MNNAKESAKDFDSVCETATRNNWCWNIHCTTCSHDQFRSAFRELSDDGSREHHNAFSFRRDPSIECQERLATKLAEANLSGISANCKFPDWLGYLGLGLYHTQQSECISRLLTKSWVPQLIELLVPESPQRQSLAEILESEKRILHLVHLEDLEHEGLRINEPPGKEWR
ncbi:MAG: hypothetical protein VB980_06840 [Opitutales bacterium]|jgi:hypothetical protein